MNVYVMVSGGMLFRKMLQEQTNGEYQFIYQEDLDAKEQQKALDNAQIIIGEPSLQQIANAKELQWIQMTWAGTDIYTATEGFPKNILLTNMTGAFGVIIAEYVMGAVLNLYRQFPTYALQQNNRIWKELHGERTLEGKRIFILGAGNIGTEVAKRMKAFDTIVVGMCRTRKEVSAPFDEMIDRESFEKELKLADIVVGCLPNTRETRHLFTEKQLRMMKQDAMLINIGRGSLIELKALETVLKEERLSGVVLDVTEVEPLPKESPLWQIDRVMITPHISGPGFGGEPQTVKKIANICCDNLCRYANGKPLRNIVDFATGYAKKE